MFNGLLTMFWPCRRPPVIGAVMTAPTDPASPRRRRGGMAGGALLAISLVAGAVIGTFNRQPTIGFLIGLGIGLLLLLIVFLIERRR